MSRRSQDFDTGDESDLVFYFREVDGGRDGIGEPSNFGGLVDLAMSGIPDGGTISQRTRAQMDRNTPVERERRIKETLAEMPRDLATALRRYYSFAPNLALIPINERTKVPMLRLHQVAKLLGLGGDAPDRIRERRATVLVEKAREAYAQCRHSRMSNSTKEFSEWLRA